MAIKVSGVNVIDNERNANVGILTATSIDVPPTVLTFSPTDGSSDNSESTNIVLTYSATLTKGSGNITFKEGSASGTTLSTIAVSSGEVSISGAEVTINPSSNLPTGKDIYVVIDEGAFVNSALNSGTDELNTYNFSTGRISTTNFSPSDGATELLVTSNIVITFSENIAKGTGDILIKSGSASGTTLQTIDVTSGAVSVSGTQATINPPSDLAFETDQYIVIPAGAFTNTDGDANSGNALINTYNFTTEPNIPPLGNAFEGGYLICCSSSTLWIVSCSQYEVTRQWFERNDASSRATLSGCSGWFIPTCAQLKNPGYQCRTHWDSYCTNRGYWSNTCCAFGSNSACAINFNTGTNCHATRGTILSVRAFRTVAY